jgi:hypothetical protein
MLRFNALSYGVPLAASALLLAACGGSTPTVGATAAATSAAGAAASTPGGASAVTDSCALITSQEASVALGADAGTPSGSGGQCNYTTAAGSMTIIATPYPSDSTAQSSYASTRTAAQGGVPGFEDVTGIGDRAFVTSNGLIEFSKGSKVVIIRLLSSGNPSTSTMTTLGQAAASRI